ncbi:hypothetical protein HDU97_005430 [Phlyctochytrium planicorne]|nr:hypothetical protein HDU97_005430 [Phlyctochytrium planicorne]
MHISRYLVLVAIIVAILITFVDAGVVKKPKKTTGKGKAIKTKPSGAGVKKKTPATTTGPVNLVFPGGVMACHKVHFILSNGGPTRLLKLKTSAVNNNRDKACGNIRSWPDGTQASGKDYCNKLKLVCDEFPFHSTTSGGARASVFCVPPSESSTQGGKLSGAIKKAKSAKADSLLVSFDGSNDFEQVKKTCVGHLRSAGISGKKLSDMTHLPMKGGDPAI